MSISPKPTTYRTVKFKSRLEAKWAVFFDRHPRVTHWTYEPCTFVLREKGWEYTPDFLIEGKRIPKEFYIEIKPREPSEEFLYFLRGMRIPYLLILYGDLFKGKRYPQGIFLDGNTGEITKSGVSSWFRKPYPSILAARAYRFDLKT